MKIIDHFTPRNEPGYKVDINIDTVYLQIGSSDYYTIFKPSVARLLANSLMQAATEADSTTSSLPTGDRPPRKIDLYTLIDRHQRALKVAMETMQRLGPDSNLLEWSTQEIEAILRGDEGGNPGEVKSIAYTPENAPGFKVSSNTRLVHLEIGSSDYRVGFDPGTARLLASYLWRAADEVGLAVK